jgi:hypothetical protein
MSSVFYKNLDIRQKKIYVATMRKKKETVREIPVSFIRRLRVEEKKCPVCGQLFMGVKKAKYCSRACLNKADYQKHADARREERRDKYRNNKL